MEQFARDARITTLYEGTTQIQALDLLGRKVLQLQGVGLKHFLLEISAFCEKHANDAALGEFIGPLAVATKAWSELTMDVAQARGDEPGRNGRRRVRLSVLFGLRRARVLLGAQRCRRRRRERRRFATARRKPRASTFARMLPRIQHARGRDTRRRGESARYARREFG